jgi:hypothetical protein
MADARKAAQLKSCPKGHLYLSQECPCEHADRERASFRQALSEGSPGSARENQASSGSGPALGRSIGRTAAPRFAGVGRRHAGHRQTNVEPPKPEGPSDSTS